MQISPYLSHSFYRFPRGPLVYYRNTRSGLSSTLQLIGEVSVEGGFSGDNMPQDIREVRRRFTIREHEIPDDALTYTLVRNPYRRLAAVYDYAIRLKQFTCQEGSPYPYYTPLGFTEDTSFADFVRGVVTVPHREMDDYIAPQSHRLFDEGRKRARYVVPLENVGHGWDVLRAYFDTAILKMPHRNTSKSGAKIEWTSEIRDLVYAYYRDDFEIFGYARDSVAVEDAGTAGGDPSTAMRHLSPTQIEAFKAWIARDNAEVEAREPFFGAFTFPPEPLVGHPFADEIDNLSPGPASWPQVRYWQVESVGPEAAPALVSGAAKDKGLIAADHAFEVQPGERFDIQVWVRADEIDGQALTEGQLALGLEALNRRGGVVQRSLARFPAAQTWTEGWTCLSGSLTIKEADAAMARPCLRSFGLQSSRLRVHEPMIARALVRVAPPRPAAAKPLVEAG